MARMERVAIRVEEKVRKQIKKAAAREGVAPAEFYRRVFEWAFDQYSRVGELAALRKMAVVKEKQKPVRKGKEAT
jgi:predicted enzyme related to lactoylglutathione lyase